MTLEIVDAGVGPADRPQLRSVSLALRPGELHAVLGPNGAGKTTLLRLLAGDLRASRGQALLDGIPLQQWQAGALARRRVVMTQRDSLPFPFSVAEVVTLGRLPWGDGDTGHGQSIVLQSLHRAGAGALVQRRYTTLSGGERARVQLARALAQLASTDPQPRYLLLDEPTASLDYAFQHRCLAEVRREVERGAAALLIVQDPTLARRYADRVSLLQLGTLLASGPTDAMLTPDHIRMLYGLAPDDPVC